MLYVYISYKYPYSNIGKVYYWPKSRLPLQYRISSYFMSRKEDSLISTRIKSENLRINNFCVLGHLLRRICIWYIHIYNYIYTYIWCVEFVVVKPRWHFVRILLSGQAPIASNCLLPYPLLHPPTSSVRHSNDNKHFYRHSTQLISDVSSASFHRFVPFPLSLVRPVARALKGVRIWATPTTHTPPAMASTLYMLITNGPSYCSTTMGRYFLSEPVDYLHNIGSMFWQGLEPRNELVLPRISQKFNMRNLISFAYEHERKAGSLCWCRCDIGWVIMQSSYFCYCIDQS